MEKQKQTIYTGNLGFTLLLRFLTHATIHLRSVLKLAAGLEHENWPERGLAADSLQFIGRVPRKCSMFAPSRISFKKNRVKNREIKEDIMIALYKNTKFYT